MTVTRLSGSDSAPATAYAGPPPTATARVEGNAVLLSLANFVYYCQPAPQFTARMDGDVVIVQASPPDGPPTRCIGPHSAVLRIEGIPAGAHDVSVRNQQGDEVTTAQVTVGG